MLGDGKRLLNRSSHGDSERVLIFILFGQNMKSSVFMRRLT